MSGPPVTIRTESPASLALLKLLILFEKAGWKPRTFKRETCQHVLPLHDCKEPECVVQFVLES